MSTPILLAVFAAPAETTENLQCPQPGSTVVFYVDDDATGAAGPWYVHRDRIDLPVKDIATAKQLVFDMRANCGDLNALDYYIKVYIRAGTYAPELDLTAGSVPLPVALEFDNQDSGAPGFPIIYSAYTTDGGATYEPVLISGGVELTDWTTQKPPGVSSTRWWTQELPWGPVDFKDEYVPRDLYVDNTRAVRAREPDVVDSPSTDGFADVETANYTIVEMGPQVDDDDKLSNTYTIDINHVFPIASTTPRAYDEMRGTEVVMRNSGAWISHRQYVREFIPGTPDPETPMPGQTRVRLHDMLGVPEMQAEYVIEADSMSCRSLTQVYLENAHEFMDEPFEWFFNPPGTAAPAWNDNFLWIVLPDDRVPHGPGYVGTDPCPSCPETPDTKIIVAYARELFKLVNCSHVEFEGLNFAHTRQELPRPVGYDQIHNGQFVPVREAMPGGGPTDTYERSGEGTPKYRKFEVDGLSSDPTIPVDLDLRLDYPRLGWFDRGRALKFFQGHSPQSADPLVEDDDVRITHGAAVRIVNGEDCVVRRSRLAHLGGAGVIIENGSGHTVSGNEVFDTGASGVIVVRLNRATHRWMTEGIQVVPDDFTITSNYIYEIGQTYLSSPAIHIGWTARYHPMDPVGADDGGFVDYNYMNELPADGVFLGNQTSDSKARPQTRGVMVRYNIVRNPAQLMDDMAGIVMMRDGDDSEVSENVVFQDPPWTTTTKRGLYTDGNSMFADPGVSQGPGQSGWTIADNCVWGYVIPFNMNTTVTCPQDNMWSNNYTNLIKPELKCRSCYVTTCDAASMFSHPRCDNPPGWLPVLATFDCGNGYDQCTPYIPFDLTFTRITYDSLLHDPAARSPAASLIVDGAGPSTSDQAHLYTTYLDLIHPTNPPALDRTPPDP
ncbi:MAG: right-handed parallel beta-helix repeat-containing protein [Phycisphaera sp.]|nr:MAG: right-handed parallel beta-helix repeat-containing protein [Phycisphaera sp.]